MGLTVYPAPAFVMVARPTTPVLITAVAAAPAPAASAETAAAPAAIAAPVSADGSRLKVSPLARKLAAAKGVELSTIIGSGPGGRIVAADIEKAQAKPAAEPPATPATAAPASPAAAAPSGIMPSYTDEDTVTPLSSMRKIIAERLTESKQTVPHFYLTVECEIDNLLSFRKELNAKADNGYKLSVNDIIIKAAAVALKKIPEANSSWSEEGLKLFKSADISVAVAIEGGLVTPVIRHADAKGLEEISNEMRELASKARDGKLQPEEYQGGTFSISNLGMFGVKQFDAVINPPQACILAVGAGEQRPVVKDGALAVARVMSCTLSVDHRAVDGAVGADYLACLKGLLENPVTMLL